MKNSKFLFGYIALCLCLFLPKSSNAQSDPTTDMIVILNPSLNDGEIDILRGQFHATELCITPVTKARLWRINSFPFTVTCPDGSSCIVTDIQGAVGVITDRAESQGGGVNDIVRIPGSGNPSDFGLDYSYLPLLYDCAPSVEDRLFCQVSEGGISNSLKIAIMDTGLDFNNTFFSNFVKLADAKNFLECTPTVDIEDTNGHGTGTTGIYGRYFREMPPNSGKFIIPYKVLNGQGIGNTFGVIQAIDDAILQNVDIINLSLISDNTNNPFLRNNKEQPLQIAIRKAKEIGNILVVEAAGNGSVDIDTNTDINGNTVFISPSALPNDNTLVVGGADCESGSLGFTNYGSQKKNLDIFAPGRGIQTTWLKDERGNRWARVSGTSFSAPIVGGIAALLFSKQTVKDWRAVKCAILKGATQTTNSTIVNSVAGGFVNADQALINLQSTCSGVLPVSLKSFKEEFINSQAYLTWETANEINIAHYTIEKSGNGKVFAPIGMVKSLPQYTHNKYTWIDEHPFEGVSYYRLKITNTEGSIEYSKTIALNRLTKDIALSIAPNPATDQSLIYGSIGSAQTGVLSIFDSNGLQRFSFSQGKDLGMSFQIPIATLGLSKGMYIGVLKTEIATTTIKIIILD